MQEENHISLWGKFRPNWKQLQLNPNDPHHSQTRQHILASRLTDRRTDGRTDRRTDVLKAAEPAAAADNI